MIKINKIIWINLIFLWSLCVVFTIDFNYSIKICYNEFLNGLMIGTLTGIFLSIMVVELIKENG